MYVVYGGVKYTKVRQAAYCKLCKETIESKYQHDYKMCSCGAIGIDFERFIGTEWEDRSVFCAKVRGKTLLLPPKELLIREFIWKPQTQSFRPS
jgi:hypothetical protein